MTVQPHRRGDKTPLCGASYGSCVYPIPPRRILRSCPPRVTEWTMTLQAHLPPLRTPQATVLALGRRGMVLARSWALTAVRALLATWLGRKAPAVRQQWREFCSEATAKRGSARQELVVETCFVPLRGWIVDQWEGTPLALARDATTLGTRCTVLALRVVSRGGAIPVAWTVLAATAQHAWRREWLRMLRQVRRAVPRAWTGRVLADRGLSARWLCRRIIRLGWPPLVRLNPGGTLRPQGQVRGVPLKRLGPQPGTTWPGTGIACKGRHRQLPCTLLACGEADHTDPWLLLTALPPEARTACWEGRRAWIAQSVKLTKRAGWQWQRPHMTKPARAARLWLAVAVAPWWLLSVGGEADATIPASTVPDVTALVPASPRTRRATRLRLVSLLRRGWNLSLVAWLNQAPRPMGRFIPEPWPAVPMPEQETPSLPVQALPQAA
jgi:hypothetical protein